MEEEKKVEENVMENNNDVANNNEVNQKNKKSPVLLIVIVILIVGAFIGGFLTKGMLSSEKENKEKEKSENVENVEKTENTEKTEPTENVEIKEITEIKTNSPVMDNIVVNLYGGGYIYFLLDNDAYYLKADLMEDGRFFLLTYAPCLRDNPDEDASYCDGNPIYKRKAIKVEGIEDVVKLRLLHRPGATDESFETFAVDKVGNAYIIKDGVATKYYGNNDVEDILSDTQVLLKDGTKKTIGQ